MAVTLNASTSSGLVQTADTSGVLQFQTNGTATATIDASGNVGIGTNIQTRKLQTSGAAEAGTITDSGTKASTILATTSGGSAGEGGTIEFGCGLGTYGQPYFSAIKGWATNGAGNTIGDLTFWTRASTSATSLTERMRIDSSGNVLVGTTSLPANGGLLFVAGGISSNSGYQTKAGNTSALSGNRFNINWTGTAQLWIDSTNIGTFAFTSDYRIKKNIETSTTPALERISQIRPVTYQMADYGTLFKASEEVKEGFIAHELAEVIPSAVEGEKDAENQIQSLKLDALCSVMVKAIQEQQTIIETLKTDIAALKAKVGE